MANLNRLLEKKTRLKQKYRQLVEDAYNFRQTDHALSDFSEYKATKVLNKINKLKFVIRDNKLQAN
ncbi:Lacal_2735 family protein [Winogradskyella flava]|uniref:Lacal_2735 family protein n=1 Tax=Winogradskyella flava TaxID=1884876 RepID=A0A842IUK0_9FLAO|nr:Lacal_2735 family protein [Winogradskyella flava]MBC2845574.1 Lacal_2735 family protein [Winogradskyella flava]